jgi:hypothetical protein
MADIHEASGLFPSSRFAQGVDLHHLTGLPKGQEWLRNNASTPVEQAA